MTVPNKKSNPKQTDQGQVVGRKLALEGRRTDAQMLEALQQAAAMNQASAAATTSNKGSTKGSTAGLTPSLTTGEVAQRLGVSRQTAEKMVKEGLFPAAGLDGQTFVAPANSARSEHVEYKVDEIDPERQQAGYTKGNELIQKTRKAWLQRKNG